MLMMLTAFSSCGGESAGGADDGADSEEEEVNELEEAQKKFDAGVYTSYSYVNDWLGIKYYPLPGMIANPDQDEELNATYDIEDAGIKLMNFRADYLSISDTDKRDGYVMMTIKKLTEEKTSDECLEDVLDRLDESFASMNESYKGVAEMKLERVEKFKHTIGGAEYSGQKSTFVVENFATNTTTYNDGINLVRYIDGYSVNIQIQGGMYSIEQILDRFDFMNDALTGADSFGVSASTITSKITEATRENLSMSSEVKCSGTSSSLYYGRYISSGMEYCIRETAGKADMFCVSMTKNYEHFNVESLKKDITEMCKYMVLPEFDTVASFTKAMAFSGTLAKTLKTDPDGNTAVAELERNGYTYSFVYVDTGDCGLLMLTVTKAG